MVRRKALMIWNEKYECMPRGMLEELQLERLKAVVARTHDRVPAYKRKLDAAGIRPSDISSLKDLAKLPFMSKNDLRDNYPFGLFAVPLSDVARIHCSSGTTGKPIVAGYTARDLDLWSEVMARTLTAAGAGRGDVVQNAYGYGLFTGGLGIHYGAERIGATVIPVSGGNTKRQVMLMKDFGTTVLACTPSYALYIAEVAEEEGIDPGDLKLKLGVLGAEPWSDQMRDAIQTRLRLRAFDIYGLTELIGPGVSAECEAQSGLHINEDAFLPEIINPHTDEVLPFGEMGELVFTSLTKEAFGVIRFRTRDITRLRPEKCACGRTLVRMDRISGRTDDMLIVRGVNVFPSQIEDVLMKVGGTEPHYEIIVDKRGTMDELEVKVEVGKEVFTDRVAGLESLRAEIEQEIEAVLGIRAAVRLVEPKSIARSEGKAKRVIDKRAL